MKILIFLSFLLAAQQTLALPVPNQTPAFDAIAEDPAGWGADWPGRRSDITADAWLGTKRTEDKQGGVAVKQEEQNFGGSWFPVRREDYGGPVAGGDRSQTRGEDGGGSHRRDTELVAWGDLVKDLQPHDGRGTSWDNKRKENMDNVQRANKRERHVREEKLEVRVDNIMGNKRRDEVVGNGNEVVETDMERANQTPAKKRGQSTGLNRGFITVDKKGMITRAKGPAAEGNVDVQTRRREHFWWGEISE